MDIKKIYKAIYTKFRYKVPSQYGKKIASGIVDRSAFGFSDTAAGPILAPISNALASFFKTIVASFFVCFSRTSSKVFEKNVTLLLVLFFFLVTNVEFLLLQLAHLPISNFGSVLVTSPSVLFCTLSMSTFGTK